MENLISPDEVVELGFEPLDHITGENVSRITIGVAQERFIEPVFGGEMIEAFVRGDYADLLEGYVAPALALYVKMLMLPMMALRVSAGGVVRGGVEGLDCATDMEVQQTQRKISSQAQQLIRQAVRIIEQSPETYPEYRAGRNILNRCRIEGGVIL